MEDLLNMNRYRKDFCSWAFVVSFAVAGSHAMLPARVLRDSGPRAAKEIDYGHRNLIKNKTQTAVTFLMLVIHTS